MNTVEVRLKADLKAHFELNRYFQHINFFFKMHGQLFWAFDLCIITTSRTLQYKSYVDSKNKKYQKKYPNEYQGLID